MNEGYGQLGSSQRYSMPRTPGSPDRMSVGRIDPVGAAVGIHPVWFARCRPQETGELALGEAGAGGNGVGRANRGPERS